MAINLVNLMASEAAVVHLCELCQRSRRVIARGSAGSSAALLAGAVSVRTARPVLLVAAHLDEAEEALDELGSAGLSALRLPALEVLPGESNISLDLFAQRVAVVRRLSVAAQAQPGEKSASPQVIIAPVQALMQSVPDPAALGFLTLSLARAQRRDPAEIISWLERAGYQRMDAIEEPGDYAVRGGIIDIFPPGEAPNSSAAGAGGGGSGGAGLPIRMDFFGDEIDKLSEIDLDTMGSDRAIDSAQLVCASIEAVQAHEKFGSVSFLEVVPRDAIVLLHETLEVTEQARGYFERITDSRGIFGPPAVLKALQERFACFVEVNQFSAARTTADVLLELPVSLLPAFAKDVPEAIAELKQLGAERRTIVCCQNQGELQRFGELLAEAGGGDQAETTSPTPAPSRVESVLAYLNLGFLWGDPADAQGPALAFVPYHELLHRFQTRRRLRAGEGGRTTSGDGRLRAGRALDTFLDFQPGDLVVHRDHGIAKYTGLKLMAPGSARLSAAAKVVQGPANARPRRRKAEEDLEEYLTLEFAGSAKLHVPATKIDQVQRYVGAARSGASGAPVLSKLGGERWKRQKEEVAQSVRDLAGELLRVRAAREHLPGIRYPADTTWQKEFEAEFPYEETDDQLAALAEIKKDMHSPRPMDRLLCGDVGYGKTEVAVRAAFKAAEFGKQVAVLVPTTILAEQHERTFGSRLSGYPFRVQSLSRFKTTKEVNDVLAQLRKGHVDIVIGTHRLLSKDVKFADLGLVVIDEEQRFGVEHKERLLSLRMTVDVLTLSATPIPRTLHMSMLGLRDISSLATAPLDRRAVVTEVAPFNERRIQQAIVRELSRDGQIYFVHNRIHNIQSIADQVQKLAPEARIVVGHGQMEPKELEKVMLAFMRREADILVSTTIIESGIDNPTANTMIINDADRFGLADLHQLRGRVGRYKHRAYCYLLLPNDRPVAEKAVKRLKAIEEFSMLGAGFKIAMRDLEIRGAGNILGPEQSGHIAAVGYEMYCQLLDHAVKELKNEPVAIVSETAIELGVSGHIPKAYIPSDARRMDAYRRLATAPMSADLVKFEQELTTAYGSPPVTVRRLIELAELRIALSQLEVRSLAIRDGDLVARTPDPGALMARLKEAKGTLRMLPPKPGESSCEVYYRPPENYLKPDTLLAVLRKHLVGSGMIQHAGVRMPA